MRSSSLDTNTTLRVVYCNEPLLNAKFPKNKISNTKYTLLTFLPKNLYEQFGRFMNLYFLLIACLQLWRYITPVEPISTWGPLIIVFSISAIKEGIDDYRRAQSDKRANEKRSYIVRDGGLTQIAAQDILVGDVVYVEDNDEFPCDMVLLSSSDPEGACYIQTANIDGETDNKSRQALQITSHLTSSADLTRFKGVIECALPNPEIYTFDSRIKVSPYDAEYHSLSEQQLLLQATHLKNTEWVYGIAVYTGNETKVGQNKSKPPVKWTKEDKLINKITIFIFCFQLSLVVIFGIIGNVWKELNGDKSWYLDYTSEPWYEPLVIPLRFLLLNSMMIPISLKVTLDIVKLAYAKFIDWDEKMYDKDSDTYACATNTSISEDMGQIEYVFSDKTGTLTQNLMVFKKCSINNVVYGDNESALDDPKLKQQVASSASDVAEFFYALALCHTVFAGRERGTDEIQYKANSPDEEALVKAAANFGFTFVASDNKSMTISHNGKLEHYEKLSILEFSSERKRMSVVLRQKSTGKIILYTKGADDVVLRRLKENEPTITAETQLEDFAKIGLRTLCIAFRYLSQEEYDTWFPQYHRAQTSLENRKALVSEACDLLERGLTLLGLTAIEDQLQDQVPETIQKLRDARIKIWMLTGDKYSTAIQIAKSCNLISPSDGPDQLISIRGITDSEIDYSIRKGVSSISEFTDKKRNFTVVIEGKDLDIALKTSNEFLKLCLAAASVICCRVTPQQKAQVVSLVKAENYMTLAIGDGGNDVVMIQEAHVGIGIAGREGLQAARAADYSIGKFRFLERLLLIHGRYSYVRTAFISQYSFFKSLLICFIQIMYCFCTGFSGTSFFNTFSLTAYNMVFTSIPVILYALDKDMPEHHVMSDPQCYYETQSGRHFNYKTFQFWVVRAFIQALLVFIVTIGSYGAPSGSLVDYGSVSIVAYTALIFINCLTVALESKSLTWINHVGIWGTLVVYFLSMIVLNYIPTSAVYTLINELFASSHYWLTALIATVFPMIIVYGTKVVFFMGRTMILHSDQSVKMDFQREYTSSNIQVDSDRTPLLEV